MKRILTVVILLVFFNVHAQGFDAIVEAETKSARQKVNFVKMLILKIMI